MCFLGVISVELPRSMSKKIRRPTEQRAWGNKFLINPEWIKAPSSLVVLAGQAGLPGDLCARYQATKVNKLE
jgi:hypothetical protein